MRLVIDLAIIVIVAPMLILTVGAAKPVWSEPAVVKQRAQPCVTYRGRIQGEWLIVEAKHQHGWHSFAIDNRLRAMEQLAGKKPLGIEMPTKIEPLSGLEIVGPWHQSEPKDFSKPDLRWYAFGFDQRAIFAAKVRATSDDGATSKIRIRGQACNDSTCLNVDVQLALPVAVSSAAPDLRKLKPVKKDQNWK